MKMIRNIDKDSHLRATALALALIKCEIGSRAGLTKGKAAANLFYTEDFDNGLIVCEYFRRADLKKKVWHGNIIDLVTNNTFCFDGATLAEVRLSCVRIVRHRFEAVQEERAVQEDLRAEYKKKFKAVEKQEKQFRRTECNECGIWALWNHKDKDGDCKYLIHSNVEIDEHYDGLGNKVFVFPLTITVKNAGCILVNKPKQE